MKYKYTHKIPMKVTNVIAMQTFHLSLHYVYMKKTK